MISGRSSARDNDEERETKSWTFRPCAKARGGSIELGRSASPQDKKWPRICRVVRRRVRGVPDLESRGRRVRDPDRLDGADVDGAPQGNRLPGVRLRYYGQRRPRGRCGRRRLGAAQRIESGTCENCRFECPVGDAPSFSGDRIYVLKEGLSLPFLALRSRVEAQAMGRGGLQAARRARGPLHQAVGRHAQRSDPNRRRRPLGRSRWIDREISSGCGARSTISRRCRCWFTTIAIARRLCRAIRGWLRWAPRNPTPWTEPSPGRFAPRREGRDWNELRYHHLVPSPAQWEAIRPAQPLPGPVRRRLITDFYSYNTDCLARGSQVASPGGSPVVSAALGGRPDAFAAPDVARARRTVSPRADQGGHFQSLRD